MTTTLHEALAARLPAARLSIDHSDREDHSADSYPLTDTWSAAERAAHTPAVVVRPESEDEIVAAMQVCNETGVPLVPWGAGSGVVGAAIPDQGAAVLDLRSMQAAPMFDEANGLITCEPGCIGGDVEAWLNERGHTLGHYPQSLHLATVGGLVATRSSGTFSSKYGGIEHLVRGLRVVLPDGQVLVCEATPRSATGPDLRQLFVGAEGQFGVISSVTLDAFPMPAERRFRAFAFDDLVTGIEAVHALYRAHVRPAVLRLYDAIEAAGWYQRVGSDEDRVLLIVGHEGHEQLVAAEADITAELLAQHGASDLGPAIGDAWEEHRFDASWLTRGNDGPGRMADAIEVAAPWSVLGPLYEDVMAALAPVCSKAMGHLSHFYPSGGCIYFICFVDEADTATARDHYLAAWEAALARTRTHGGTLSHHHGVGLARRDHLAGELGIGRDLLVRLKTAIDPDHRCNPGKFAQPDAARPQVLA